MVSNILYNDAWCKSPEYQVVITHRMKERGEGKYFMLQPGANACEMRRLHVLFPTQKFNSDKVAECQHNNRSSNT